jgi:hypothetical protein
MFINLFHAGETTNKQTKKRERNWREVEVLGMHDLLDIL